MKQYGRGTDPEAHSFFSDAIEAQHSLVKELMARVDLDHEVREYIQHQSDRFELTYYRRGIDRRFGDPGYHKGWWY